MLSPFRMRKLINRDHQEELATAYNNLYHLPETVIAKDSSECAKTKHTVRNGIERIHVVPHQSVNASPVLLVHGMWHNASCWTNWQNLLARHGVESVAFSLPGHGKSPVQRPVAECSLPYYLRFVCDEVERMNNPILVGHSMGGALVQWYLRYVGEVTKAAFIASWTSHDIFKDSIKNAMGIDPIGTFLSPFLGWKFQLRNPRVVQKWFLSPQATEAAEALYNNLGPESEIVLMQHRPPKWQPNLTSKSPKLWMGASQDAIIPEKCAIDSAKAYSAQYVSIDAGHNIMLDTQAEFAANKLANWVLS